MRFFTLFCLFFTLKCSVYAEDVKEEKKTICLNMIVKDESKVIARCLASVKPIINYWVIVDTGSTDGTQEIIREYMADIPGELEERQWKNFEHNRNQALDLAKGKADYVLLIDADEILEFAPTFKMPLLEADSYNSIIRDAGSQYDRTLLIKNDLNWRWHGVLHEYLSSSQAKSSERLNDVKKISNREGARSADPKKYEKDAQILEAALKESPNNSRYVFYLAQSYRDAGNYTEALKNYQKRILMDGWDQEIYYSMLQIARMQEISGAAPEIFMKSYYDAYHYRPSRAEPLYYLAKYYRSKYNFASAYLLTSIGMAIPFPKDILFVDKWVYDYDMEFECSINAYWIGKYEECDRICRNLLTDSSLPQNVREAVERNLGLSEKKIAERDLMN